MVIWKLENEIAKLKAELHETNDKSIMFAVGEITEEEYEETKNKREFLREEINAKELEISILKAGGNY